MPHYTSVFGWVWPGLRSFLCFFNELNLHENNSNLQQITITKPDKIDKLCSHSFSKSNVLGLYGFWELHLLAPAFLLLLLPLYKPFTASGNYSLCQNLPFYILPQNTFSFPYSFLNPIQFAGTTYSDPPPGNLFPCFAITSSTNSRTWGIIFPFWLEKLWREHLSFTSDFPYSLWDFKMTQTWCSVTVESDNT